jgi:proline iminopeptidase
MKAKIRDTEIYFDIEGCGLIPKENKMIQKSVAFLLHGGPGADHSSYKPTFSPLSEHLQLVYFDHRGQGRSARGNKNTYTLDNNVEDMEALRQYLGLDKIIVIGSSYGGMVALNYAINYPEKVEKLIVIATAPSYKFRERAQEILAQKGTKKQQEIAEYLWNGTFKNSEHLQEYFETMGPLYSQNFNLEKARKIWERTILSTEAINVAFSSFLKTFNLVPDLPKITAPTLVIGAAEDWICPPEFSQEIANNIPNSQLKIIEDTGHLIRADQPKILLETIINFIK